MTTQQKLKKIIEEHYGGEKEAFLRDVQLLTQNDKPTHEAKQTSEAMPDTRSTILSVNHLTKRYEMKAGVVTALNDISTEFGEGELVAIMGPSGSGKSTLLNLIGALDTATEGDVTVGGKSIREMTEATRTTHRNQTVGFVFQFFYLQPFLDVVRNVETPLMFRNMRRSERRELAEKAVQSVGLSDRMHHMPNQLSGGQMQRVAIARALVTEPKIILADEPTGNLDQKTGREILTLLKRISREKNTTVIIITHDEMVREYVDRTIYLSDGNLL